MASTKTEDAPKRTGATSPPMGRSQGAAPPSGTFPKIDPPTQGEIRKLFERVDDLVRTVNYWRSEKGYEKGYLRVDPPRVVTAVELREDLRTRIADEAIARIWREKVLEPAQVALALGAKVSNREKASSLRKRSWLLGVPRDRGYLYPAFQIDVARRRLYPEVRHVNETLGAAADPWGVASWWLSTNDRLGARPADLVGSRRAEELVQAAKAVTAPIG